MHFPSSFNPIWLVSHATGNVGVSEMLRRMAATVKLWKNDANLRELAERIITEAGAENSYRAQSVAIHDWVRNNIKYMRDPEGVEQLKPPGDLLATGYGDCDDTSVLVASLNAAIGHPVRLQAVGFDPSEYSHVFAQVLMGRNNWVTSDTTPILDESGAVIRRFAFGEEPDGIGPRKVRNI